MPTRLSRYCEGVMEAAWLAAVVVVPVFFDIYSGRIFEPDKIALLRTLALVILAAWIVKTAEEGGIRWGRRQSGGSSLLALARVPLALPAAALVAAYLISTLFSVTPRVSLWGSYQRLQGTYTTLAYLTIFAAILAHVRRRAQVERLITAIILASLPVGLYGILQHYDVDPLPWGGDVVTRIAANMGNAIFVAAYLIMVIPLTAGRLISSFAAVLRGERGEGGSWAAVLRAGAYVFIAAVELAALYFSGSRGPWLGWLAGSFFMFVFLSLLWRKRWLTLGIIGVAAALGVFLIALNIPGGPLEPIRAMPGMGRLGHVFETDRETGRVRVLIWEGAAKMVAPHPPIEFPDGRTDAFNFLRPFIGYGPESMYVAFNPFYPPELGRWESRSASPDRSHNETWDALVITGALGLIVYLALFASVFYYGLKWLGLIGGRRQRALFAALYVGGGAIGAAGFVLWRGVGYFGVGPPFGIILGLIAYLTLIALFGRPAQIGNGAGRALMLIPLVAAIVAHFVEIHFGIAIVVTRLYFWTYSALLVVVGHAGGNFGLLAAGAEAAPAETASVARPEEAAGAPQARRKRRRAEARARGHAAPGWRGSRSGIVGGGLAAILLVTLGFDYVNDPARSTSIVEILRDSLTRLPVHGFAVSYGVLALVLTTAGVTATVLALEPASGDRSSPGRRLGATLAMAVAIGFGFWLWQAGSLASLAAAAPASMDELIRQVARLEGRLTGYYAVLIVIVVALARFLPDEWPAAGVRLSGPGRAAAGSTAIAALVFGFLSNLQVIQADIAFKTAEPFAEARQWPVAIALYQRAIRLAPSEDYYYLFLGRGYLELANLLTDPAEQAGLVEQAERDLRAAQSINPLNTDHTANLARLYRWWASLAAEPGERQWRGQASAEYYARALRLSPNNATLWNEWAVLHLNVLGQPDTAYERLAHSLEVDPYYDATHAILGDYYAREGRTASDEAARAQALEQAAVEYRAALQYARPHDVKKGLTLGYYLSLGKAYADLGRSRQAIETYLNGMAVAPAGTNLWAFDRALAELYEQAGEPALALAHANDALEAAPEAEKAALQGLIFRLQSEPSP